MYEPDSDSIRDGLEGNGPVIMAVDILPTEIPLDSSIYFSGVLKDSVSAIAKADYGVPFEKLDLPDPIKKAVILYNGELTPEYEYISKFL